VNAWSRWRGFSSFKREYGDVFGNGRNNAEHKRGSVLVVSFSFVDIVKVELGLIKGLELAGFEPVVLTCRDRWLVKYFELAGVKRILFWDEYLGAKDLKTADRIVQNFRSFEDLLSCEHRGVRVGRFAASTLLRQLRLGSLDLASSKIRRHLVRRIADGIAFADGAAQIVERVGPQIALFAETGYTPQGELFDTCLAAGIDAVTWNAAHKSNALILKRYTLENRGEHYSSLSNESWDWMSQIKWEGSHRQRLQEELFQNYGSGDWYSEVGTQFHKRFLAVDEIRSQLGLHPKKKTAVIFPHMLWDATLFWGKDLFRTYEEWFIQTVRTACQNDHVNWVIKIHPANLVKNVRDGVKGEASEVAAIRKHFGELPQHLFFIPADHDLNTFSLFELMDYCVTVRGTIGIEAASFGVPVLTAGTGRYDHKGFTIDSESQEEYLQRLREIQHIPPLTPEQRELAERFAYGVFVLRPLPLTSVSWEFERDREASYKTRVHVRSQEDWQTASDMKAFAEWVSNASFVDFLSPVADAHTVCS